MLPSSLSSHKMIMSSTTIYDSLSSDTKKQKGPPMDNQQIKTHRKITNKKNFNWQLTDAIQFIDYQRTKDSNNYYWGKNNGNLYEQVKTKEMQP